MFKDIKTILYHDILITMRNAHTWLTPLLFFVVVVSLFPFALGADQTLLNKVAPGLIWVAVLLAVLLSIGNLFKADSQEGYLDLLFLSKYPLTLLVFCKIASHWLTHSVPLIFISPLFGFLLNLTPREEYALIITLLLGTPVLSLIGAVGAALMVGVRGHGLLLPILIMPLYIPVLIFGTGTVLAANTNQILNGYFAIMGALFFISLAFAPLLTAMALKIGVNQ